MVNCSSHYYSSINKIVEIPLYNLHLFNDCEYKDDVRSCPKCKAAVLASDFKTHQSKGKCRRKCI